jgi:hypothetical protein
MKIRNLYLLSAAAIVSSCGTSSYFASNSGRDAVYDSEPQETPKYEPQKKNDTPQLARLKEKTLILSKVNSTAKLGDGADTIYFRIKDTLVTDSTMTFEELITKFDNPTYIINLEVNDDNYANSMYPWWGAGYYGRSAVLRDYWWYVYTTFYGPAYTPYSYWTYSPFYYYDMWFWYYPTNYSWMFDRMYAPYYFPMYYYYYGNGYGYAYPYYGWYGGGGGHYANYHNDYGWRTNGDDYYYGNRSGSGSQSDKGEERSGGSYRRVGQGNISQTSGYIPDKTRMASERGTSSYRRDGSSSSFQSASTYSAAGRARNTTSSNEANYRRSTYNSNSEYRSDGTVSRYSGSSRNSQQSSNNSSNNSSYPVRYSTQSSGSGSSPSAGSSSSAGSSAGSSGGGASHNTSGGGSVHRR